MEPQGIGLRVRRQRQALGLTIKEAAARAGINPGTLSSIELYYVKRVPSCLPAIAQALEVPLDSLLADTPGAVRAGGKEGGAPQPRRS